MDHAAEAHQLRRTSQKRGREELPHVQEMLRGLKKTLCTPGPRDPTETEIELCLSVSCGGMGQQWTVAGAGGLNAADLGTA